MRQARQVLLVYIRAPVASFRRPLDHNYQRTLPMPPPTTILGIAGAALGLSDWELWSLCSPLRQTLVSVWMESEPGRGRDMWTLLKIKAGKMERSPYIRELLFFVRYVLVYGDEERVLKRLQEAFLDPVYPLSLGREDELAMVEKIELAEAVECKPRFWGTILPGDIRQMSIRLCNLRPGLRLEPPIVETLPLRFSVDAKRVRHPQELRPFSFLPLGFKVEVPDIKALQYQGRSFTWLNS